MTEGDRVSIIAYVRERFDTIDERIKEARIEIERVHARIETLELERDHREGRNSFIVNAAKTIGGLIAAVLAALGIKSQIG